MRCEERCQKRSSGAKWGNQEKRDTVLNQVLYFSLSSIRYLSLLACNAVKAQEVNQSEYQNILSALFHYALLLQDNIHIKEVHIVKRVKNIPLPTQTHFHKNVIASPERPKLEILSSTNGIKSTGGNLAFNSNALPALASSLIFESSSWAQKA